MLKRFATPPAVSGLTMKRWAVAGLASFKGERWATLLIFSSAEASANGLRQSRAPESSAPYFSVSHIHCKYNRHDLRVRECAFYISKNKFYAMFFVKT